ncbi:MAG: hypothetical protein M3Z01_05280, partial [Thermoproteota archaeon]|nr:hypothetical protein [Thermoproteota archaeon]
LDVISAADWIIDLGPEGGNKGGQIIANGPPEEIINNEKSYTTKFLKEKLSEQQQQQQFDLNQYNTIKVKKIKIP